MRYLPHPPSRLYRRRRLDRSASTTILTRSARRTPRSVVRTELATALGKSSRTYALASRRPRHTHTRRFRSRPTPFRRGVFISFFVSRFSPSSNQAAQCFLRFRNIAPSHSSSSSNSAAAVSSSRGTEQLAETVSATGIRVSRLAKDADLWPSRRKRTTFANHFIIVPASQRGDTIYMKFLDTVSPSLSRARSGSCKKLIEPFIGPATRCMSSLKYQGFSFRNLLEQDIKILLQPTQEIATIQGNVTGYT